MHREVEVQRGRAPRVHRGQAAGSWPQGTHVTWTDTISPGGGLSHPCGWLHRSPGGGGQWAEMYRRSRKGRPHRSGEGGRRTVAPSSTGGEGGRRAHLRPEKERFETQQRFQARARRVGPSTSSLGKDSPWTRARRLRPAAHRAHMRPAPTVHLSGSSWYLTFWELGT